MNFNPNNNNPMFIDRQDSGSNPMFVDSEMAPSADPEDVDVRV
jgi:hypothetical protein